MEDQKNGGEIDDQKKSGCFWHLNICIQNYAITLVVIFVDKTGHHDVISS